MPFSSLLFILASFPIFYIFGILFSRAYSVFLLLFLFSLLLLFYFFLIFLLSKILHTLYIPLLSHFLLFLLCSSSTFSFLPTLSSSLILPSFHAFTNLSSYLCSRTFFLFINFISSFIFRSVNFSLIPYSLSFLLSFLILPSVSFYGLSSSLHLSPSSSIFTLSRYYLFSFLFFIPFFVFFSSSLGLYFDLLVFHI